MTRIRIKWRQCGAATRLAVLGAALILVPLCGYVFAQVSGFSGFSESIATLADGDSFGADDADDSNQSKSVLASVIKTYTSSAPTITGVATFSGTTRYSVDAGVSATGTGQGDGYDITENVVQVTTITAASAEAVVLPTAAAGAWCFIINDDATDGLKIFPASGDDLGEGIDTVRATDLAAGSNIMFRAYDATNWEEIAGGGGVTIANDTNDYVVTAVGDGTFNAESGVQISSGGNLLISSSSFIGPQSGSLLIRVDDNNTLYLKTDTTNEGPRLGFGDTGNDNIGFLSHFRGTTSDATPVAINESHGDSFSLPSDHAAIVRYDVIARDQTSGDVAAYEVNAAAANASGTTALKGTPTLTILHEDDTSWTVDVVVDDTGGTDYIDLQVTGDATNTVTWCARGHIVYILE